MPVDKYEARAARGIDGLDGHLSVAAAWIDRPRLVVMLVAVLVPMLFGFGVAAVVAAAAIVVSIAVFVAGRGIRNQATQAEDNEGGEERALHITPILFLLTAKVSVVLGKAFLASMPPQRAAGRNVTEKNLSRRRNGQNRRLAKVSGQGRAGELPWHVVCAAMPAAKGGKRP